MSDALRTGLIVAVVVGFVTAYLYFDIRERIQLWTRYRFELNQEGRNKQEKGFPGLRARLGNLAPSAKKGIYRWLALSIGDAGLHLAPDLPITQVFRELPPIFIPWSRIRAIRFHMSEGWFKDEDEGLTFEILDPSGNGGAAQPVLLHICATNDELLKVREATSGFHPKSILWNPESED